MHKTILTLLLCFTMAHPSIAQDNGLDERSLVKRVANWNFASISPSALKDKINAENARLVDLEVVSTNPLRFSASLVKNTGAHASGWWWLYNTTPEAINALVDDENARLVDIETYKQGGVTKFAAVFIANTGQRAASWHWYFDQTPASLKQKYDDKNQRLIDIERYRKGGETKFAAIMVDNSGSRQTGWYWYRDQTAVQLKKKLSDNNMRLIDIESYQTSNGVRHAAIMKSFDRKQSQYYWHYHGITKKDLNEMTRRHGARVIDIEKYGSANDKYSAILLNNGISKKGHCSGKLAHFADNLIEKMKEQSIPGAQIAIVKGNRLVYSCGLGLANINKLEKVTPDNMFRIASISKLLTMSAIRDLAAKGDLSFDDAMLDALGDRAPEPLYGDVRMQMITVQHLLDHRGGWSRHEFDPMLEQRTIASEINKPTPLTCQQIIDYMLTERTLDFQPGSNPRDRFDPYSNFGYCVLGRIIHEASGVRYAKYVKDNILKPAGVTQMRLGNSRLAEAYPEEVRYYDKPFAAKVTSRFPQDTDKVKRPYGGFVIEAHEQSRRVDRQRKRFGQILNFYARKASALWQLFDKS